MRKTCQIIARGRQTMMPMGAARKSRSMEKVEKPTALQPQEMTFQHARTIEFTLVSPAGHGLVPCQLVVSSDRVAMKASFAIRCI